MADSASLIEIHSNENTELRRWTFSNDHDFTLGRSLTSSVVINNSFISRNQCFIRYENQSWVLHDTSSLKSTYLNGCSVSGGTMTLGDGDIISFSHGSKEMIECNKFKFHCRECPPEKKARLSLQFDDSDMNLQCRLEVLEIELDAANKQIHEKTHNIDFLNSEVSKFKTENQRLETENRLLQIKFDEVLEKTKLMEEQFKNVKNDLSQARLEVTRERDLYVCSETSLRRAKEQLEDAEVEIESLVQCLNEKDLDETIGNLCAAIPVRNVEVDSLRNDLALMTEKFQETSKMLVSSFDEKDTIVSRIKQMIDNDLICSVCQDILYKATTLSCKHTFCEFCIKQWTHQKNDCPMCRCQISCKSTSLLIDTVIDNLIKLLDEEMQERRRIAIAERNAPPDPAPRNTRRGRGRGSRGGRRRGGRRASLMERIALTDFFQDHFFQWDTRGRPTISFVDLTEADQDSPSLNSADSDMSLMTSSDDD